MCCTRLAENTRRKSRPRFAICAPSHKFVGLYLHNEGMYRQSEKNLLNISISSTCPRNMVNFGSLTAQIVSLVWGTPATCNFNGFRVLASLLQRRRSRDVKQTLHDVWPSPGLVHYIYIFWGCCPRGNFARCKTDFASMSCTLLYWQRSRIGGAGSRQVDIQADCISECDVPETKRSVHVVAAELWTTESSCSSPVAAQ